MSGWDMFTDHKTGIADADYPTAATVARRRQADLDFLAWVKVATMTELEAARPKAKGWRLVAIQRRLSIISAKLNSNSVESNA